MIIAHVFLNHREANYGFMRFMKTNAGSIKKSIHYKNIIIDNKGNEHHFIADKGYERWCKGKTYMLDGSMMHSGYPYFGG